MSVDSVTLFERCPACKAVLRAIAERGGAAGRATLLSVRCTGCGVEVWPCPDEPLAAVDGEGEIRLEISVSESERYANEARRELGLPVAGARTETDPGAS